VTVVGVVIMVGIEVAWRPVARRRVALARDFAWRPAEAGDPRLAVLDAPLAALAAVGTAEVSRASTSLGPMAVAWADGTLARVHLPWARRGEQVGTPVVTLWSPLDLDPPASLATVTGRSVEVVTAGRGLVQLVPGGDVAALVERHRAAVAWLAEQGIGTRAVRRDEAVARLVASTLASAEGPVVPVWVALTASARPRTLARPLAEQPRIGAALRLLRRP
jgi:hypothetical protein